MGSKITGGVFGVAAIGLFLGGYLIYAGTNTAIEGLELASTGGEFEDVYSTLGGFWRVFGLLYLFLGILCFIVSFGLMIMKEWARRNGVILFSVIAALNLIMGMTVGFFGVAAALPSFVIVAVSGVCAIYLWMRTTKDTFELAGYRRPRITEENIEVYSPQVVMRGPVKTASESSNILRCPQCDTMNMNAEFCKMCGTELD